MNSNFKKQIDELENDKRKLEQCANDLRLQLENMRRSADETTRERDHSKLQLETTNYEKNNLEKVRMVLLKI
jgi:phage shock protein A